MRPCDYELAKQIEECLRFISIEKRSLPGINDSLARATFVEQLLESIRRVKYASVLTSRKISQQCTDPNNSLFDPLKAAIFYQRQSNFDEAYWMVFLFIHFGKHPRAGWRYIREIYGRFGEGSRWDWVSTSSDPSGFRQWLHNHEMVLRREGVAGGFGNHRKYESLSAYSDTGTGAVVESYIQWVRPPRTHQELFDQECRYTNADPRMAFERLFKSMYGIIRFGRTARFDYLCMIGKLGLAPIIPGSAYLQNSTGPIKGARLLFSGDSKAKVKPATLEQWLLDLDTELNVGMQVIEDALCNWQKSPREFKKFRG